MIKVGDLVRGKKDEMEMNTMILRVQNQFAKLEKWTTKVG